MKETGANHPVLELHVCHLVKKSSDISVDIATLINFYCYLPYLLSMEREDISGSPSPSFTSKQRFQLKL